MALTLLALGVACLALVGGTSDTITPFAKAFGTTCDARQFGAKGDNVTEDTDAIQAAVDACSPGMITLSAPGVYLSRPVNLTLRHDTIFNIEAGATLTAWREIATWAGKTGKNMSFLFHEGELNAELTLRNFTLTGGGTIDGQGWRWWPYGKTIFRPILAYFNNVDGLLISNLTFRDTPSWNTNLRGANIEVAWMTVLTNEDGCSGYTSAPNTDGFNIGGHDIHIHDSYVHNGDDCIPVFSWNHTDTYNVLAERVECHCGTNGGVVILGNYSNCAWGGGNIRNVTFRDMLVNGTNQGAGMKICNSQNNATQMVASDVTWENVHITGPRFAATYINVYNEDVGPKYSNFTGVHCAPTGPADRTSDWMRADGFTFRNVTGSLLPDTLPGCFLCAPESPCSDIVFDGVDFTLMNGAAAPAYNCSNVGNVSASGNSVPAPCGV